MTTSYSTIPIVLESRDVYTMYKYNNESCRKCQDKLVEGDIVIRTGKRHAKYYHKNCFKQY